MKEKILEILTEDFIKLGPRIHPLLNKQLEIVAESRGISKNDLFLNAIEPFITDDFAEVLGEEYYNQFLDLIKKNIIKYGNEHCFILVNDLISANEVNRAKQLSELAFEQIGLVDRNTIIKLLTIKKSFTGNRASSESAFLHKRPRGPGKRLDILIR
ncbi:MAG: hypothetical protein ACRCWG_13070 [Sarcina sp.]